MSFEEAFGQAFNKVFSRNERPSAPWCREHCLTCGKRARVRVGEQHFCMDHFGTPCAKCGRLLRMGMWPTCRFGREDHGAIFRGNAQRFDPVVVHFNPTTGKYRCPGSTDAKVPSGFVKQELRTIGEVRKFQKAENENQRKLVDQRVGRANLRRDMIEQRNRPSLRSAMAHMSEFGRDFARLAIDKSNASRTRTYDPGVFIDAFENNRGNRGGNHDPNSGLRRGQN